jgi:hypothetical protein
MAMDRLSKTIPRDDDSRGALRLLGEVAACARALRTLFDPYRPERHYMRGPGPRWRAKHAPGAFALDLVQR